MKKLVSVVLSAIMCASLFSFTACGNDKPDKPDTPTHTTHVDANKDGKCDECGAKVDNGSAGTPDKPDTPTNPDKPDKPDTPTNPDKPDTPDKPDVPDTPVNKDVVDESKTVSKIEIAEKPTKNFYEIGDTFTVEGGTIKVTYSDGSTQVVTMGSESFDVAVPNMGATGTKNINVKLKADTKKKVTFTITIANKTFKIKYNLNYEGAPEAEVVGVVKGNNAEDKKPTREGYTFMGWYANCDFIYKYDFTAEKGVQDDAELFAMWKKDGATYFDVNVDRGYYGDLYENYTVPVESGKTLAQPQPITRFGYDFDKWVDESGSAFDFSKPITKNTKITATWKKTLSGVQTYTFEAEFTNLMGKTGPAFSGTCSEDAMIVEAPANRGCSNGYFVSFLYAPQNSLEFYIACDEDNTEVTLYARLSAELRDFTYTPENYGIYLNDVALKYDAIEMKNVPQPEDAASALDCLDFKDYVIGVKLTLKKGANLVRLVTENSIPMEGSTLLAAAPIVDAIKIETTAVVIWDANHKLPYQY